MRKKLAKITPIILVFFLIFIKSSSPAIGQTTPVYGNMAIVTAGYEFKNSGTGYQTSGITYCGQPMIFTSGVRSKSNASEIWRLANPPSGSCPVVATFVSPIKEKNFTSTVIKNVDVATTNFSQKFMLNYEFSTTPMTYYVPQNIGNNILVCSLTTHPEGGRNLVTPRTPKVISSKTGQLLYHAVALSVRRSNTTSNTGIGWNSTLGDPTSGTCIHLNLNPNSTLAASVTDTAPLATPSPTPNPNQGLTGRYYDNKDFTSLVTTRVDNPPFHSTSSIPPAGSNLQQYTYSIRWDGYLRTLYGGNYIFTSDYDDAIRVWLNDQLIINKWTDNPGISPFSTTSNPITLSAFTQYKIRVEHYQTIGNASINLKWQNLDFMNSVQSISANNYSTTLDASTPSTPPIVVNSPTPTPTPVIPSTPPAPSLTPSPTPTVTPKPAGLTGKYYNNKDFTSYVNTRIDSQINFNTWGTGAPTSGVGNNTFSVRWNGFFKAPVSGNYTFYTQSDDGVRLFINGVRVINNWTNHLSTENTSSVVTNLIAGQYYRIQLDYYDDTSNALIQLKWSYPGRSKQIIPASMLFH